jgi:5'-methylthioadenosine phosphorylase
MAESLGFQARGADVIGMTGATEAQLAREAEISYATVAHSLDFAIITPPQRSHRI